MRVCAACESDHLGCCSSDDDADDEFKWETSWGDNGPATRLREAAVTGDYQRITEIVIDEQFDVNGARALWGVVMRDYRRN